jgi:hypothetical protein
LIAHLLNRFLLSRLSEVIGIDLETPLEKAKAQINQSTFFNIEIGNNALTYQFNPKVESFAPNWELSRDGIHLQIDVTLTPLLALAPTRTAQLWRAKTRRKRPRRRS